MDEKLKLELMALVAEWKRLVKLKFFDAETEENPMGRKLIEHGAMCYFNCLTSIEELVAAQELRANEPFSGEPDRLKELIRAEVLFVIQEQRRLGGLLS